MLESVNNNQDTVEEDVQGLDVLIPNDPQQNIVIVETSNSAESPNS